ncbi:MAG: RIP metalloprotease RseP [Acidobacteria bacterium]|nr:MAG: RIP metalloprotease RseP [Acidobacteriota bacterium]
MGRGAPRRRVGPRVRCPGDGWSTIGLLAVYNGASVTSIIAFLFVLGVLIFVHELGHFLMARRIGVRVLTFSLGFGPKLLSFRRGDTEYCISAVPLGGYVKMAGENPEDTRTGASDEFLSKGKWQRFQVLVMGPVMNILLAFVVMAAVLYRGAQLPLYEQQPVVIGTFAPSSVAQRAGLKAGDRIVTIDDRVVDTWEDFSMAIVAKAKRQVSIGYVRDNQTANLTLVPEAQGKFEIGDIGIQPTIHPQVVGISKGQPADEGGLQAGDVIMTAAGEPNIMRDPLLAAIKSHKDQPLPMTVKRGGRMLELTLKPREIGGQVMIGAQINALETHTVEPGPVEAMKLSVAKNWEWTTLIVQTLKGLFTRETSVKQLMGPVAIADLSGSAAQAGWIPLFTLMAMISLNLGLLNLMPIPVLDGGHIFILALEGLARRDFSMRVKEKMLLAGFVLLLMLMVTVIYNDLMRIQWIEKLVPWR